MRKLLFPTLVALVLAGGCSSEGAIASPAPSGTVAEDAGAATDASQGGTATDGGASQVATPSDAGGAGDAADAGVACSIDGNPGQCITVAACGAIPSYTATPGYCPGPASIECCAPTPNVASNPPIPAGYKLMAQADVTPAMTTWAVAILNDPTTYPMFATTSKVFGALTVLARVEWHPPDFQNAKIHRGVTLYQPI